MKRMKSILNSSLRKMTRHTSIFCLCLISLMMTSQPTEAVLLLQYNFDEVSGNALDVSGAGVAADASLINLATRTTNTPSATGNALNVTPGGSFTNYAVAFTGTNKLNASIANLTLTTWINLQGMITNGDRIMGNINGTAPGSGFDFAFNSTVAPTAAILTFRKNSTGGGSPANAPVNLTNKWVFLSVVYNGANVSYYTGTVANAVAQLGTSVVLTGSINASTNNFQIGATPASVADRTPPAWFDDVRVYNHALTPAQLEVVRQSGIPSGVAPNITAQPANQTIYTGGNPTFSPTIVGDLPMQYQWYLNGTNVGDIIADATNSSLTLTNVQIGDSGSIYTVFASNSFGTAWNTGAVLTVVGVQITTQPTPVTQTLLAQSTALFSAVANGASPLAYQWYFFGTNNAFTNAVVGATNATLALPNISDSSVGVYALFVTNAFGSAWSSNVTLAAVLPLYNTTQATNLWTLPLGSRPYLSTNAGLNLERGLTFNPANTNLLLVSRGEVSGFSVVSINALTGADNYSLDTNGISGGTFPINMIRASSDGAVYAANLTTAANTTAYKIYRWSDDAPATLPTLSFSGDPGFGVAPGLRWGDNLALRGTGNDTQILLASGTGTNVALLTTSDGGLSFTPAIIPISGVHSGFAQYGLTFGPSTNTFWAKTSQTNLLYLVTFDINTLTGSATYVYSNTPNLFRGIGTDSGNRWLAGVANESPDTMRLYDVSAITNAPMLADQELLGTGKGLTGSATIPADTSFWDNQYVFVLDPFNGVSAFQVSTNPTLSANADLTSLVLTPAGALSPSFASGQIVYSATNDYNTTPTVTVTNADVTATSQLIYNGVTNALASGTASSPLTLTLGANNVVRVLVSAQDGLTRKLYTVNVSVLPSQIAPVLTNSVSGSVLSLNWSAGHLGYRLLTQTNNLSLGVSSNPSDWETVSGSAAVTATNITISPSQLGGYFRLVYP